MTCSSRADSSWSKRAARPDDLQQEKRGFVLTDHWDISHICIAVDDLEAAKAIYGKAYGVTEWGPLLEYTEETGSMDLASQVWSADVGTVGLRQIWAKNGSDIVAGGPPFACIELAEAEPA